jgi:hypothetical protein
MGDTKAIETAKANIRAISEALTVAEAEYLKAKKRRDIIATSCAHEKVVRVKNIFALAKEALGAYQLKASGGRGTAADARALKANVERFKNNALKIKAQVRSCSGKVIELTSKPVVVETTSTGGHPMDKGLYFGITLSSAGAIDDRWGKGVDRYAISKTEAKFIFSYHTFISATLGAGYRFLKNKALTLDLSSITLGGGLHILLSRKAMLELGIHAEVGALVGKRRDSADNVSGYHFSYGAILRFDLIKFTHDNYELWGVPEEHNSFGALTFAAGVTALF